MIEAVERARAERSRLGLDTTSPVSDLLGLIEFRAEVPVILEQLGNDAIAGAYAIRRGVPFIFLNSSNTVVRLRFTLAHEFGHHVLGHGLSVDKNIDLGGHQPMKEVQANAFAEEFLMPLEAVDGWLRSRDYPAPELPVVVEMARDFLVSARVVCYRLKAADRLTGRLLREVDASVAAGDHLEVRPPERPLLPESLFDAKRRERRLPVDAEHVLLRALEQELIGKQDVGAKLRLDEHVLSERLANLNSAMQERE